MRLGVKPEIRQAELAVSPWVSTQIGWVVVVIARGRLAGANRVPATGLPGAEVVKSFVSPLVPDMNTRPPEMTCIRG